MLPPFKPRTTARRKHGKKKNRPRAMAVFFWWDVTLRQDAYFISVPRMCPILFMASHSCGIAHTWCLPYATRMDWIVCRICCGLLWYGATVGMMIAKNLNKNSRITSPFHQTFQVSKIEVYTHLYKLYGYGLCKGKPTPKNSRL